MLEVRCCCQPENLVGLLPAHFRYERREMDNGDIAFVSESMPAEVQTIAAFNLLARAHKKGKGKSWKKKK